MFMFERDMCMYCGTEHNLNVVTFEYPRNNQYVCDEHMWMAKNDPWLEIGDQNDRSCRDR